ncbi:MAG: hypothetical protein IPI22_14150 [Bacteroidetes bacterium]|nr:hypothetical protein [Bacteroidota bacterium]
MYHYPNGKQAGCGTKLESSDKLSWITSSEQNNAYFNLQHSTDGISFSTIAKVSSKAPNGNSNTLAIQR